MYLNTGGKATHSNPNNINISVLDYAGLFGCEILGIMSLLLLLYYSQWTYMGFYVLGSVVSMIVNMIIKYIIKEPRPEEDAIVYNYAFHARVYGKKPTQNQRIGFDRYGMPSGHAQSTAFSAMFMFLALPKPSQEHVQWYYLILALYAFLTVNTMLQRVRFNNHTIRQVVVGALVGSLVAYGFYTMAQKSLRGKLRKKEDDNAPH